MSEKRFKQANREAGITLGLYAFFFLWWTLFAFGFGSGEPEDYTYVLGLPAWFFYSCVLGYPVLTLLLWLVVRRCFKDMPLDGAASGENSAASAVAPGTAPGANRNNCADARTDADQAEGER